jgi:hypothetical protein
VTLSPDSLDTRRLVSVLETALAQEASPARQARMPMPRAAQSRISRLLLSAVHDASMLTGSEKASALSVIIRAALVAAPERVKWLIAEAETAARSIEDAAQRSSTLADLARLQAAGQQARIRRD